MCSLGYNVFTRLQCTLFLKVNNVNNYRDVTNKMHDWIFDECHQMVKVNIFH